MRSWSCLRDDPIGELRCHSSFLDCHGSSSSVEAALKKLVEDGTLRRLGAGRKTLYVRADFESKKY